jgi:hypothetical protein
MNDSAEKGIVKSSCPQLETRSWIWARFLSGTLIQFLLPNP